MIVKQTDSHDVDTYWFDGAFIFAFAGRGLPEETNDKHPLSCFLVFLRSGCQFKEEKEQTVWLTSFRCVHGSNVLKFLFHTNLTDDSAHDRGDPVAQSICNCPGSLAVTFLPQNSDLSHMFGYHDKQGRAWSFITVDLSIRGPSYGNVVFPELTCLLYFKFDFWSSVPVIAYLKETSSDATHESRGLICAHKSGSSAHRIPNSSAYRKQDSRGQERDSKRTRWHVWGSNLRCWN